MKPALFPIAIVFAGVILGAIATKTYGYLVTKKSESIDIRYDTEMVEISGISKCQDYKIRTFCDLDGSNWEFIYTKRSVK